MRSLLRAVVVLSLLTGGMLTAVIGLTYRDTPSRFAWLFRNWDGSACQTPCLSGVEMTTLGDAYKRLQTHPMFVIDSDAMSPAIRNLDPTTDGIYYWSSSKSPFQSYLIARSTPNTTNRQDIDLVSLSLEGNTPTLAELIMLLGRPRGIAIFWEDSAKTCIVFAHFVNREFVYSIRFECDPDIPYFGTAQRSTDILFTHANPFEMSKLLPWLGFASYNQYLKNDPDRR